MRRRSYEVTDNKQRGPTALAVCCCLLFLAAVGGLHALFVVEDGLADTGDSPCDLQQLVVGQKLQALLQAHLPGRHQPQGIVGAGGPGVGQLLFLADVDGDVLLLGAGTPTTMPS